VELIRLSGYGNEYSGFIEVENFSASRVTLGFFKKDLLHCVFQGFVL
jgi:hypothetical protein